MARQSGRLAQAEAGTIRLSNSAEAVYWAAVFGISLTALDYAVQAVGTDAEEVRAFITRAKARDCSARPYKTETIEEIDRASVQRQARRQLDREIAMAIIQRRIASIGRQIMSMERKLVRTPQVDLAPLGPRESIDSAYELLRLYRRRLEALRRET